MQQTQATTIADKSAKENADLSKTFYNAYCDLLQTAANNFLPSQQTDELLQNATFTDEEILTLARFVLMQNKLAGVGKINLKSPSSCVLPLFEEFDMSGKLILPLDALEGLQTKDFIGEKIALEISDLVEENEKTLSYISDLAAKMKIPLIVHFGKTLEEVGILSQKYKASPARILEDFGLLDRKISLLGCNFIDKDDLDIIASYDAQIILSPRSDMMLGRGAVNLYTIQNKNITYHLASDAYPQIDMPSEATLAQGNTANLLYERGLINTSKLSNSILADQNAYEELSPLLPLENAIMFKQKSNQNTTKSNLWQSQAEKIIKEKILWK